MNLYGFQEEMVDHLASQKSRLCGDDMGLGKTVEAIALDKHNRIHNPPSYGPARTLVVTPLSTVETPWLEHFQDWAPHLKVIRCEPKNRHLFVQAVEKGTHDVYICHWESLRLMPELAKKHWFHIVADEVHKAKNRKSQQTRALKKIKCTYKTAMSGTWADNKPHDAWSVLNWLWPTYYRSYWKFFDEYLLWELVYPAGYRKVIGVKNIDKLRSEMRPWYIRRRKEDVLKDLPDKYYTDIWVELTPKQKAAYKTMKRDMIAWIGEREDQPVPAPVIVAQLMRLQQFAVAFAEVRPITVRKRDKQTGEMREVIVDKIFLTDPSAKIDALMDILEDTDEPVVVFSNFKQAIDLVRERCERVGKRVAVLTGDTKQEDRGQLVKDFQSGQFDVFIGTIAAGGVGITLTRASTVVFLDRAWSPSQNRQAEDRLHRIGQTNAVQVIDIMARNTVDLGRRQQLKQKWDWLRQILGDVVQPKELELENGQDASIQGQIG